MAGGRPGSRSRGRLGVVALIVAGAFTVAPGDLAGADSRSRAARSGTPAPPVKPTPGKASPGNPRALKERSDQWIAIPGERVGMVTPRTSEEDLVRIFGPDHVARRPLALDDGETRPGTIVLGSTLDALEIFWRDDRFVAPERVIIGGGKTRWRTRDGVTIGTSLDDLTRLNGRPFRLLGFGWARGGLISSWEGGRLAGSYALGRTVVIRLGPDRPFDELRPEEREQVVGPQEVSSDHPALVRLGLRVWEIVVLFP